MKKIFLISVIIAFAIVSCDKVKNPVQSVSTSTTDTNKYIRKILIEDYTGHTCGNCPAAAISAENFENQYKGKIVIISVHAGDFAKVKLPDYPASYTTTVGNDWNGPSGFGISSSLGNPAGMINRKSYGGNPVGQKITTWPTSVSLALGDVYILKLYVVPNYNSSTRKLNTTVSAVFKTTYPNNTNLTVVLTEDSVSGPQTDYTKTPDLVTNYIFRYMLRGDINGSWGSTLKNTPIAAKDSVSLSYNDFAIDPTFNDKQVYIVAFVSDATTKEVLQVEKVRIR